MRNTVLILLLAASTVAASAQTPANPAPAPAKPATAAKSATAAKPAVKTGATSAKSAAPAEVLPAGVPVIKGPKSTLYSVALRYQDDKVGDGAAAEPGKLLKFHFTLWTAGKDGVKFDSSLDHPGQPVKDKDGKPVLGDDGKPKLGDPQPMPMIMGQGRPIPGWDLGAEGMKVNGKRLIFIPWELGFGAREIPAAATHPAVPAKSDLILYLELKDVSDAPQAPQRPSGGPAGMHPPMGPGPHPMPGAASAPPAPGAAPGGATSVVPATPKPAPAPTTPAAPSAPAAAPAPATPATPPQPQSK
jgi:FKBP-type peptidyl-prolyl cis-trans isomerase